MEKNKTPDKVKNILTSDIVVNNFILLKNRWWFFLTVSIIAGVVGFFLGNDTTDKIRKRSAFCIG